MSRFFTEPYMDPQEVPDITGDSRFGSLQSNAIDQLHPRDKRVAIGPMLKDQRYTGDLFDFRDMHLQVQPRQVISVADQGQFRCGQSFSEHATPYQGPIGNSFSPGTTLPPTNSGQLLSMTEGGVLQYDAFASEYLPRFSGIHDLGPPSTPTPSPPVQQVRTSLSDPEDSAWFSEWLRLQEDTTMRQHPSAGAQQVAWNTLQDFPHMEDRFIIEPQVGYYNANHNKEQSLPYSSMGVGQAGVGLSLPSAAFGSATLDTFATTKEIRRSEAPLPTFRLADNNQLPQGFAQTEGATWAETPSMINGSFNNPEQNPQATTKRVTSSLRDIMDPRQSVRTVPRDKPQWNRPLGLNFIQRPIRPAQSGHFPLFKLPPEIRNMVYRHIFVSENCIGAAAIAAPQFFRAARSLLNRNFLLTSRQVHGESAHIFYCENLFAFAYVGAFLEFLKRLSKEQRQLLTRMRLSYSHGNLRRALEIILKDCHRLHGLEIRIRSTEGGPYKWTWNAAPILNPIDVVRGLVKDEDVKLGSVVTVREERDEPLSWVAQSDDLSFSLRSFLYNLGGVPRCFRSKWNPIKHLCEASATSEKPLQTSKQIFCRPTSGSP
ncbi:MAG: hypothetical protein M1836_006295 [Candelina mexicana]|nr:MAG: hypothetical protein M1836_006295 [Candelina mexicana]